MFLSDGDKAIIRQIVNRVHVGESNLRMIRYSISKLREGYDTYARMPRNARREFLRECIKVHTANRMLYISVMSGRM